MSSKQSAAAKADAEAPAKAVIPLREGRLTLTSASAGQIGNVFAAVLPAGQAFDDVLSPEFWALCAQKLRRADEIVVHNDDMTFTGRLYVRDVSGAAGQRLNNRAVVDELYRRDFKPLAREMRTQKYEVLFKGPHEQWAVIAIADQRIVKSGFGTPEAAGHWMRTQAP